jgi:hypothetical protein
VEEFNLLDPVSGCPVKVRFFHIYLGDGFLYYRPVHLILANGKQYHCYFYDDFWARLDQFTEEGKWLWAEKGSKQNLSSDHLLVAVKDILTRGLVEKAFALTPTPESTWHWILEFYNNYPEFPWWEYLKPFRGVGS